MPFRRTYYHLVWGTKNRQELIAPDVEPTLFQYLTNKAVENGIHVYALNGWFDHVHLVGSIPPKIAVATAVKRLKGASSYYINEQRILKEKFVWQRGYGVLTMGERHLEKAIAYVERQKEHHQNQTTNSWLERIDVDDAGPKQPGLAAQNMPEVLREPSIIYEIDDPFPF